MTMDGAPRRRLDLPAADGQWPRVGKVRLGEQLPVIDKQTGEQKMRAGEGVTRPAAIDYFRVDGDDGITSPDSAASFREVFGAEPRVLRCQIPGRRIDDVWEGAYRLYGARKLKQRCDGVECDVRTATGGWETRPCVCRERGIFDVPPGGTPHKDRCKLGWTLNFLLPEVQGVGVWQVTTGSEISVKRISGWLQMMQALMGDLLMLEFELRLVPEDVAPDGKVKQVWVLEPRAVSASPRELLTSGRPVVAEIPAQAGPVAPPPADDDDDLASYEEVPADVEHGAPADDAAPVLAPELDALWRQRFQELAGLGLTNPEIAGIAKVALGRVVNAWELHDDKVYTPVLSACLTAAEERAAG